MLLCLYQGHLYSFLYSELDLRAGSTGTGKWAGIPWSFPFPARFFNFPAEQGKEWYPLSTIVYSVNVQRDSGLAFTAHF